MKGLTKIEKLKSTYWNCGFIINVLPARLASQLDIRVGLYLSQFHTNLIVLVYKIIAAVHINILYFFSYVSILCFVKTKYPPFLYSLL